LLIIKTNNLIAKGLTNLVFLIGAGDMWKGMDGTNLGSNVASGIETKSQLFIRRQLWADFG
jgi:hypothetical protein